jgi:hypothetical protein
MMTGRSQFVLLSLLLSSCASSTTSSGIDLANDPRIDQAPLNNSSRVQVRNYFSRPNAKAFAFEPATGKNWHVWGQSSAATAQRIAMRECEKRAAQECALFAVNDDIVWQPVAAVQEPEPSMGQNMTPLPSAGRDIGGGDMLIAGLFKEVPPPGSPWSTEDQIRWLEAAQHIFGVVYNRRERINIEVASESPGRS